MTDLAGVYHDLVGAQANGLFEEVLLRGTLGAQPVKRHPLGFTVVQLKVDGVGLRLHLWKGGPISQPGYEIHDHAFNLKSFIVDGTIRHRTFEALEDPQGDYAVYSVHYEPNRSVMTKTPARARLKETSDEVYVAGQSYSVPAWRLHDALLHGAASATTLVLTRDLAGAPVTYGPADGPQTLEAARAPVSHQTLADLGLARARAF